MDFKCGVKQYATLLKTLILNLVKSSFNENKREKLSNKKKIGKAGVIFLVLVGVFGILAYLVMMGIELTIASINSNMVEELQYGFIALSQIMVVFFGVIALVNNLYSARDTALLSVMPFRSGVIYGAKFTISYLSELLFSALIYLPLAITSGIVLINYGYPISWSFFLVSIINFLLIPAIPLLVATLLSQPIQLFVNGLKRKTLGKSIVTALFYIVFFAIYFILVLGVSTIGESGALNYGAISVFTNLKKITIFNYPLVQALIGKDVAVNLLIYIGGVIVVLALSIILSTLFYRKSIMKGEEGDSGMLSQKKKGQNLTKSVVKSYIHKDLNTLLHTPNLFINVLMGIVLPAVFLFLVSSFLGSENEMSQSMNVEIFTISFATYFVSLMCCAGNPFAYIGFSLEGKNLYMIKSMPIGIKDIVKAKYIFACIVVFVSTVIITIVFPFATGIKSVVALIGLPLHSMVSGLSFGAMGLYSDLKNPNLKWTNINELTRNNMKVAKTMLLFVGFSFLYLVVGIVIAVFTQVFGLNGDLMISVYYCLCILVPAIVLLVNIKRLFNSEEIYRRIGG